MWGYLISAWGEMLRKSAFLNVTGTGNARALIENIFIFHL